jgi:hypothetical protein
VLAARCGEYPDKCETVYQTLARFSREKRDPGWADSIEPALQKMLANQAPSIRFRRVECRSATCIVELIVDTDDVNLNPKATSPLGRDIHVVAGGSVIGYVKSGSDSTTRDVLVFYSRTNH